MSTSTIIMINIDESSHENGLIIFEKKLKQSKERILLMMQIETPLKFLKGLNVFINITVNSWFICGDEKNTSTMIKFKSAIVNFLILPLDHQDILVQ